MNNIKIINKITMIDKCNTISNNCFLSTKLSFQDDFWRSMWHFEKYVTILLLFYCTFDEIKAALVSIKDFLIFFFSIFMTSNL